MPWSSAQSTRARSLGQRYRGQARPGQPRRKPCPQHRPVPVIHVRYIREVAKSLKTSAAARPTPSNHSSRTTHPRRGWVDPAASPRSGCGRATWSATPRIRATIAPVTPHAFRFTSCRFSTPFSTRWIFMARAAACNAARPETYRAPSFIRGQKRATFGVFWKTPLISEDDTHVIGVKVEFRI